MCVCTDAEINGVRVCERGYCGRGGCACMCAHGNELGVCACRSADVGYAGSLCGLLAAW